MKHPLARAALGLSESGGGLGCCYTKGLPQSNPRAAAFSSWYFGNFILTSMWPLWPERETWLLGEEGEKYSFFCEKRIFY